MSASAMPIHHMSLVLAAIITNASGLTHNITCRRPRIFNQ